MSRIFILVGLFALSARLAGCSVPVSYYALMRWPSGDHRIAAAGIALPPAANAVAVDEASGRLRAYFPSAGSPWWDAPLPADKASAIASLCDSPLRRELTRRLARAESAVWILLESGDAKRDDDAAALLQRRLDLVAKTAALPDPSAGTKEDLIDPALPPRLAFSLLRLRRDDQAEAALRAQLLHVEDGLEKIVEPLAFAVFGRGRVLPPLHGAALDEAGIDEVSLFLVGSCSCEVKEQNPGVDLLLQVDWEAAITRAELDTQAGRAKEAP